MNPAAGVVRRQTGAEEHRQCSVYFADRATAARTAETEKKGPCVDAGACAYPCLLGASLYPFRGRSWPLEIHLMAFEVVQKAVLAVSNNIIMAPVFVDLSVVDLAYLECLV